WLPCTTCINENRTLSAVQRAAIAAGGGSLRQFHGGIAAVVPQPERGEPAYPADRGVFRLRVIRAAHADGGAHGGVPAARADRGGVACNRAPVDAHHQHGRPDHHAAGYANTGCAMVAAAPARFLCRRAWDPTEHRHSVVPAD